MMKNIQNLTQFAVVASVESGLYDIWSKKYSFHILEQNMEYLTNTVIHSKNLSNSSTAININTTWTFKREP
jgi:hypothetical protein